MYRIEDIQQHINELAALIGAPEHSLPTYDFPDGLARPYVEVEPTRLSCIISERGTEYERRVTTEEDELRYWVFKSVTFSMASNLDVAHRREHEDSRRQLFSYQLGLLERLKPDWKARHIQELEASFAKRGEEAELRLCSLAPAHQMSEHSVATVPRNAGSVTRSGTSGRVDDGRRSRRSYGDRFVPAGRCCQAAIRSSAAPDTLEDWK